MCIIGNTIYLYIDNYATIIWPVNYHRFRMSRLINCDKRLIDIYQGRSRWKSSSENYLLILSYM